VAVVLDASRAPPAPLVRPRVVCESVYESVIRPSVPTVTVKAIFT
jgi:hypothetical protein